MLGHPPTRLKQVFSFISLSYAMTAVMKNCNIEVPFSPGVEDFWALRQTIEDEHKQHIFDRLLMFTWPEDAKHSGITNEIVSMDSILDISFEEPISPGQLVGDILKGIVMRLFKAASADEAFNFSAFLDINLNPVSKTPPVPLNTDVGTNRLQKSGQGDRKKDASKPTCSTDARRTVIFQRIYYFMIFISRYGIVLIYFGDEERRYRLPTAKDRSVTVRDIIEAAVKTISTNFNSLCDDERFSSIRPFFAAIEQVHELGLIWCILDTLPEPFAEIQTHFSHSPVSKKRYRSMSAQPSSKRRRRMDEGHIEASTSESERSAVRQSSCQKKTPSPAVECNSCDSCPKKFYGPNSLNTLRRHEREKHSDNPRQYRCRFCPYQSKRKGNLDHHENVQHIQSEGETAKTLPKTGPRN